MISITDSNRSIDSKWLRKCQSSFSILRERDDLGFHQLPDRELVWSSTAKLAAELSGQFSDFVFVGIGGSSLGGRAIHSSLAHIEVCDRVHFLENLDQTSVNALVRKLSLKDTAFVFVSKSGGTIETLALCNQLNHELEQRGLHLQGRSIAITESKQSLLFDWAKSIGAQMLEVPLDVGGRFSVLTPVGLLPAALMGVNLEEIREGASWALEQKELVSQLAAHGFASFERDEFVTQFWPYSDRLYTFGLWLQQLWAESLAKATDREGKAPMRVSTPIACLGAIDQHSLLQQIMEGEKDKFVQFFKVESNGSIVEEKVKNQFSNATWLSNHSLKEILDAEQEATKQAMKQKDVSFLEVSFQDFQPKSLGAGFMIYQLLIGVMGEVMNINAFNQPGVELGKGLAKKIL
jgi:glucose-6-phosphate isomerase